MEGYDFSNKFYLLIYIIIFAIFQIIQKLHTFVTFFIFALYSTSIYAQITNLNCTISTPNDLTKKYNSQQNVVISATWQGGTQPFAATFMANGIAIGTINTSSNNANFGLSAVMLPEGNNVFSVQVIETAIPTASPPAEANAAGLLVLDKTPPSINFNIISGHIVSPNPGSNIVTLSFTSNEELGQAPVFVISPGSWSPPSPTSPESPPYTSNQYTITVPPSTPSGVYTVKVTAYDNTEPTLSRNSSSAQLSFRVISEAIGSPVITRCSPNSPFNTSSITLFGTVPAHSENQTVEVLENGSVKARVSVPPNNTNWSADINGITNGEHVYIARRIDHLGNISSPSPEFKVVADRIPPTTPQLEQFLKPVNKKRVTIRGTNAKDPQFNSIPVKVSIYALGSTSKLGEVVADDSGNFSCEVELPSTGINHIYAQSSDTTYDNISNLGNISSFSSIITINVDTTPPTIASGGIVISANSTIHSIETLLFSNCYSTTHPNSVVDNQSNIKYNNEFIYYIKSGIFIPQKFIARYCSKFKSIRILHRTLDLSNYNYKSQNENLNYKIDSNKSYGFKNNPLKSTITYQHTSIPFEFDNGFYYLFPNQQFANDIFYRIEITDHLNNKIYIPKNGELYKSHMFKTNLKIQANSDIFYTIAPEFDVWSISEFGLPSEELISSYRRIILSSNLDQNQLNYIKNTLNKEETSHIIVENEKDINHKRIPNENNDNFNTTTNKDIIKFNELKYRKSISKDIKLLKSGKLPPQRVKLLIHEIINGVINPSQIPSAENIPNLPHYKPLKETIQFLNLHNSIPSQ